MPGIGKEGIVLLLYCFDEVFGIGWKPEINFP
jgi:hypothetical protein